MKELLAKKPEEMTVGDTLGYLGLISAICYGPILGYLAFEAIRDKIREKKIKKILEEKDS